MTAAVGPVSFHANATGYRYARVTVSHGAVVSVMAAHLVTESCWYSVDPLPDSWDVAVRSDCIQSLYAAIRKATGEAPPAAHPDTDAGSICAHCCARDGAHFPDCQEA